MNFGARLSRRFRQLLCHRHAMAHAAAREPPCVGSVHRRAQVLLEWDATSGVTWGVGCKNLNAVVLGHGGSGGFVIGYVSGRISMHVSLRIRYP